MTTPTVHENLDAQGHPAHVRPTRRHSVHCAPWEYGHAWAVYDGFEVVDVFASPGLAQAVADYRNHPPAGVGTLNADGTFPRP